MSAFPAKFQKIPQRFQALLNQADYGLIVNAALEFVQNNGSIQKVENGVIYGKFIQNNINTFGLDNIIRYCLQETDRTKWPELIDRHFSIMLNLKPQHNDEILSLDSLKSLAMVRLYAKNYFQDLKALKKLVYHTDLEGTISVIVLDYPDHFEMLSKNDLIKLKISEDEVFALAIKHLKEKSFRLEQKAVNSDMNVFIIENDEYAASMALCLNSLNPLLIGKFGSLVAAPAKSFLIIYPLERNDLQLFIQEIDDTFLTIFSSLPQPVSPFYYWYYRGNFKKIIVKQNKDKNILLSIPKELEKLFNQ